MQVGLPTYFDVQTDGGLVVDGGNHIQKVLPFPRLNSGETDEVTIIFHGDGPDAVVHLMLPWNQLGGQTNRANDAKQTGWG